MRAVIQRTTQASVTVASKITGEIRTGLLVLIGISKGDTPGEADYLANRIVHLRCFPDESGKMNLDVQRAGGSLLVVPNFTLYADCTKGRRPAFDQAENPVAASPLYEYFLDLLRQSGTPVYSGVFGADMKVHLCNDGPVTFVVDTPQGRV